MKEIPEFENFFELGKSDLKLVEKNLNDEEIRQQLLLFHLQQAIEKFLKALLSRNNIKFPKVHDIEKLIEICNENNIQLPDYVDDFIDLTPFAVEFRYGLIMEETVDIKYYLEKAEKFKTFIKKALYED
ncbi:HEPN domain-containing protein [Thermodesulfovibrio sp. TK110]|jgi:HEPN domain-containing protein